MDSPTTWIEHDRSGSGQGKVGSGFPCQSKRSSRRLDRISVQNDIFPLLEIAVYPKPEPVNTEYCDSGLAELAIRYRTLLSYYFYYRPKVCLILQVCRSSVFSSNLDS